MFVLKWKDLDIPWWFVFLREGCSPQASFLPLEKRSYSGIRNFQLLTILDLLQHLYLLAVLVLDKTFFQDLAKEMGSPSHGMCYVKKIQGEGVSEECFFPGWGWGSEAFIWEIYCVKFKKLNFPTPHPSLQWITCSSCSIKLQVVNDTRSVSLSDYITCLLSFSILCKTSQEFQYLIYITFNDSL